MFSLFRKRHLSVRVREQDSVRYLAGVRIVTDRYTYKDDVTELQRRFYERREELLERTAPRGTMVVFGTEAADGRFSYFIGDLVDSPQQDPFFTILPLEPGPYASITVDFKVPNDLALSVMRRKHQFYQKWLPASGYRVQEGIESIELYDRRSEIELPSVDLIFPLIRQ